jgi:hypothetical protein
VSVRGAVVARGVRKCLVPGNRAGVLCHPGPGFASKSLRRTSSSRPSILEKSGPATVKNRNLTLLFINSKKYPSTCLIPLSFCFRFFGPAKRFCLILDYKLASNALLLVYTLYHTRRPPSIELVCNPSPLISGEEIALRTPPDPGALASVFVLLY